MRRTVLAAVLGALTAVSVLLAGGGAAAAPPPHAKKKPDNHERTLDYWTEHRLDKAVPRAKGRSVVKGRKWKDETARVARTTGKVFFLMGGQQYVCSASAIGNGGAVDLVLTAGHCVYDEADGYASFFLFIPGYAGGGWDGYDVWTAESVFTTDGWHEDTDLADDTGLAVVTSGDGGPSLRESLGPLPTMATDLDYSDGEVFSAFGYPSENPYKGVRLGWCQGPVEVSSEVADTVSLPCRMSGGASGGPWYAGREGTGRIASVNSFGFDGVQEMFGPTFDDAEERMLAEARDGACASAEVCSAEVSSTP